MFGKKKKKYIGSLDKYTGTNPNGLSYENNEKRPSKPNHLKLVKDLFLDPDLNAEDKKSHKKYSSLSKAEEDRVLLKVEDFLTKHNRHILPETTSHKPARVALIVLSLFIWAKSAGWIWSVSKAFGLVSNSAVIPIAPMIACFIAAPFCMLFVLHIWKNKLSMDHRFIFRKIAGSWINLFFIYIGYTFFINIFR